MYDYSLRSPYATVTLSITSYYVLPLIPTKPYLTDISSFSNILINYYWESAKSILVNTTNVRDPSGLIFLANFKESLVDTSTLAYITHNITVFGFYMYLSIRAVVISSMLSGWSEFFIGIFVMPGKSTIDKSVTSSPYIFNTIGSLIIPFL